MKKILLISFAYITTTLTAQEDYKSYYLKEHDKSFKVLISKKDSLTFYSYLKSEEVLWDKILIVIRNPELDEFVSFLKTGLLKFKEWDSIAKANKISNIRKDISEHKNNLVTAFYMGEWKYSNNSSLVIEYIRIENNSHLALKNNTKIQDISNEFINHKGYFSVFSSFDEFNNFIQIFNNEDALKHLNLIDKKESLFKN